MKQIYISGSLAYDRIMKFPDRFANHILPDKIDNLNVAFVVGGLEERFGGTAGNIAYSLALLQESPLILATAGRDFDQYQDRLTELGLSLEGIRRVTEELTAGAYITTDEDDNQITVFNLGAMKFPTFFEIDPIDSHEKIAIVSPGNVEDMQRFCQAYRECGLKYIFDPGQQTTLFSGEELLTMLTGSYILITNAYELEMIMNAAGLDRNKLLNKAENIITTLGASGSAIYTQDNEYQIGSAKADKVADPTGAGDCFRSGLIKGLTTGKSLVESAQMGATAASFSVEHLGTQEHHFTLDQFWARYEKNF